MLTLKNVGLGNPPMDKMSKYPTRKKFFSFYFTLLINKLESILSLKYVLAQATATNYIPVRHMNSPRILVCFCYPPK